MCMVSGMLDYGRQNIAPTQWTPDTWSQYNEILRRLAELDKKLGQPDCEDPEKAKWMKDMEERMRKLEDRYPASGLTPGGSSRV